MKKFFQENKIVLAILIGALIIGEAIYLSGKKENFLVKEEIVKEKQFQSCRNVPFLPNGAKKLVTKIIDGDTFLIEGGYSVRILGIDADERGYPCYQLAKERLEELILNKKVILEKGVKDKDKWCRYLRYVFLDGKNISLELVKEGLAVSRVFPEDIKYKEEIIEAEREAKENKIGCKWSFSDKKFDDKKVKLKWEKLTEEKQGVKVIDACLAKKYLGKEVIVEGKVVDTYRSKTNTVFLNFEKPYPNQCFSGVIFSSYQGKFVKDPENYYLNKVVRVKGKIKQYQGKPEIILKDSLQIEIGK